MNERVRYELRDGVALVTLDDGKANAISHETIAGLLQSFDRAEREARAVLLAGRPGRLSAGFDLATMRGGPEQVRGLVEAGARLLLRLYLFPRPLVAACTGHALAAGALLLLASDRRIGALGDYKIGLNEVAIGLTLPVFAVELARDRLSKRHFTAAATQAEIYDPAAAVDAGFLDSTEVPEALAATAFASARRLADLGSAFGHTKRNERWRSAKYIEDTLAEDMARISAGAAA
jgi:enoyl-CoA hydratase